jgi:hypothetical protein
VHSLTHEPNFHNAVRSINTAVQRALADKKTKYTSAAVLSLLWENDDLNLGPITQELLKTFGSVFGFKVENYVIPTTSTTDATKGLQRKIRNFCGKFDGEGSLLVVTYGGYSESHPALGLQIL